MAMRPSTAPARRNTASGLFFAIMNSTSCGLSASEISEIAGPAVVGYFLNWGLLGTLTLQLYLYYQAFPKDRAFTNCLVYGVYAIVLVQTMLMTRDAVTTFVYHFGDLCALAKRANLGFEWFSLPIMSGLVAFIGQSFYAYRIHVLSKSWKMPLFIVTVSLVSCIGTFMAGYFAGKSEHHPIGRGPANNISAAVGLIGSALSDIIITTWLTCYLLKRDTGFRGTHALILRLTWITIETGCVTAVTALVTVILVFVFPDKPYFFTPAVVLPMVYANTLLAVLNSRFQILDGRRHTPSQSIMSTPSFLAHSQGSDDPNPSVQSPIVTIEREAFGARELDNLSKTKA
ncbi:hypothetical protein MVEN_01099200 [Mycena venus]|uniref:DUF6534 domain-containing protein n=1 Tax=Mycena venus TaxID=2733690 RepID=A0A8H7D0E7_9AGAR|nr:hypothetical protein MVEN_01099200 [Mycena venus]